MNLSTKVNRKERLNDEMTHLRWRKYRPESLLSMLSGLEEGDDPVELTLVELEWRFLNADKLVPLRGRDLLLSSL